MGKAEINSSRNKKELYLLLDKIPSEEINAVKRYLQYIIDKSHEERFYTMLENAPIDDEPLTEEDLKDIEKAKAEIKAGKFVTLDSLIENIKK